MGEDFSLGGIDHPAFSQAAELSLFIVRRACCGDVRDCQQGHGKSGPAKATYRAADEARNQTVHQLSLSPRRW
jgi:hypothetical protein